MSRFKDFGAGSAKDSKEPIVFKIHGEDYTCVPEIQGKALLKLVADSGSNDPVKSAAAIDKFFDMVLEDESLERFNALVEDKHRIVTVETLTEIITWLMEQYTDRPEEQPEV